MSTGEFTHPGQQAGDGPQEQARQYAGQAQEKAEQLGGQAQEKAQQLGGQAQEKAQEAADQARGKLREQLDQRTWQVAGQINEQASDLRAVSESLRQQGKDGPARAANTQDAVDYCLAHPRWRLSIQSHKVIGIR